MYTVFKTECEVERTQRLINSSNKLFVVTSRDMSRTPALGEVENRGKPMEERRQDRRKKRSLERREVKSVGDVTADVT